MISLSFFSVFNIFEDTFAKEMSIHQQWKEFSDLDSLKCSQGHILLQKNDGIPACVMPYTFEKLIDRGYTDFNSSLMSKHPVMMNQLMQHMISNEHLMHNWHGMLKKNPSLMMQTMNDFVTHMKNNPELLKNMLGPMTSEPELRQKMIQTMKHHSLMETTLKQNPMWMDSVHQHMMDSEMGHGDSMGGGMCGSDAGMGMKNDSMICGMDHESDSKVECPMCEKMKEKMHKTNCSWCPEYQMHSTHKATGFSNSERMMDMMHEIWINSATSSSIHREMLKNPTHMAMMSQDLMETMLNAVMDDEYLRQQMIELMLEHNEFMNSIRHDNPSH